MPAQSGDPISAVLHHQLTTGKKKEIDSKLIANAQKILNSEIKYSKTPSCGNPTLADLKDKYIILTPTTIQPTPLPSPSPSPSPKSTPSTSWSSPVKQPQNHQDLPQPKRVLYPPDSVELGWKGNVPIGSGFVNMGNTCYLNSTLQALFHVPAFVNWLTSDSAHFSKCESMNGLTHSECLICAMSKVLQAAQKSTGSAIKPIGIYSKLRSICKHLVHGHQEDAHEFLRYLMEGMERSYLTIFNGIKLDTYSKETTPLNQIFGGYMRTEVSCLECQHVSTTFQHFQDILLDIRQASTVDEALENYFSRERLGDGDQAYKCEQCKKRVAATKKFSIERTPKVLCIQLKRFGTLGGKNNKHISLKINLDLSKFRHRPPPKEHSRYKLVSLVTHLGHSSSCGHYTAVGLGSAGTYYLFDDSCVRALTTPSILNSNAYILMYELEKSRILPQSGSKLVLDSSNLNNGISNGFNPQKTVNGVSNFKSHNGKDKNIELSLERLKSQESPSTSSLIRPASSPSLTSPSPPPLRAKTPMIVQPSTSKMTKSESLVPYTESSESESGSPPRTQISCDVSETDSSTRKSPSKQNGVYDKEESNPTVPVVIDVKGCDNDIRPDSYSPAGSSSSGPWSITSSTDRDRSPEREEKSKEDRNKERDRPNKTSVVDELMKNSYRGLGQSVQSWMGSKSELDREVEAENTSMKRSHSSYDSELDRGRSKKFKNHHNYDRSNNKNVFQEHQNRRLKEGGNKYINNHGHHYRANNNGYDKNSKY